MSSTLPVFTPIEDSLFLTLCGRALDNRLARPILGEPEVALYPTALRRFTRLAAHSTTWSRRGTTVLHYRF